MAEKDQGFFKRVYEIVALIPCGRVTTYGRIAALIGSPRSARSVGWAMHSCPERLPSHRVVPATGSLALALFGSEENWREVLAEEGVFFLPDGRVNVKKCLWP